MHWEDDVTNTVVLVFENLEECGTLIGLSIRT